MCVFSPIIAWYGAVNNADKACKNDIAFKQCVVSLTRFIGQSSSLHTSIKFFLTAGYHEVYSELY